MVMENTLGTALIRPCSIKKVTGGDGSQILSRNIRKGMGSTLVIGGPGSGKTASYMIPNILQAETDYIVNDPEGSIYSETKLQLEAAGYEVRRFMPGAPGSCGYNPFEYIKDGSDALTLAECVIAGSDCHADTMLAPVARNLLTALILYISRKEQEDKKNMATLYKYVTLSASDKDGVNYADIMFERCIREDPDSEAETFYAGFRSMPPATRQLAIISCLAGLRPFASGPAKLLTGKDTLGLSLFRGEKRQALFISIPDREQQLHRAIAPMLFRQASEVLAGKDAAVPVHMMMDNFCGIGRIPGFADIFGEAGRHRMIWSLAVSSREQMEEVYRQDCQSITDSCRTVLCLGAYIGSDPEWISRKMGESVPPSARRKHVKTTLSALMTPDDLKRIPDSECLVIIDGCSPMVDIKFPPGGYAFDKGA